MLPVVGRSPGDLGESEGDVDGGACALLISVSLVKGHDRMHRFFPTLKISLFLSFSSSSGHLRSVLDLLGLIDVGENMTV